MTEQEIERIRTFLGSEYSVTKVDGSVVVEKKVEEPIRVKIKLMQTDSLDRKVLRFSLNRPVEIKDEWEFFNHIEEAIESYLNKKP